MSKGFSYDVDKAAAHLAEVDKTMAKVITEFGVLDPAERRRYRPTDAYGSLVRSITGQQLSVKAAQTIFDRLKNLFGGQVPSTKNILAASEEDLRSVGMSRPKAAYLKDLAAHIEDGRLEIDKFGEMSDEDIIAELTAVKGLGEWTAHMFLIFYLERPDVLPVRDLGIRNAAFNLYGLKEPPGPTELTKLAEPWRPYRSLGSLYLWHWSSNSPA